MPFMSSFTNNWDTNKQMPDLAGKVAIVTGGNTGLGKEIVRHLALHNAKVYMASRTESRALAAIEDLKKDHPELADKPGITFLHLDLASLDSCMQAAITVREKEERLDILINNAGIMSSPYELSKDGFEMQFQSNHLGHFAFTLRLLPLLIKTSKDPKASVRIVTISSGAHTNPGSNTKFNSVEAVNDENGGPIPRYGKSKLANILFSNELARMLSKERIFCESLNPGGVNTEITRGVKQSYPKLTLFFSAFTFIATSSPYQGAITPLYLATSPDVEEKNWRGEFFVPGAKLSKSSKLATDSKLARDLWDFSAQILKDKTGYSYPEADV